MEHTPATLLQGNRKFTWFKSAKSSPSEYEAFTVGQRSSPLRWLRVGWPLRFEDGSEPFSEASTVIRCMDWEAYRDSSQLWQRPYVAATNHDNDLSAILCYLLYFIGQPSCPLGIDPAFIFAS